MFVQRPPLENSGCGPVGGNGSLYFAGPESWMVPVSLVLTEVSFGTGAG
jgi:hypothetical protein